MWDTQANIKCSGREHFIDKLACSNVCKANGMDWSGGMWDPPWTGSEPVCRCDPVTVFKECGFSGEKKSFPDYFEGNTQFDGISSIKIAQGYYVGYADRENPTVYPDTINNSVDCLANKNIRSLGVWRQ